MCLHFNEYYIATDYSLVPMTHDIRGHNMRFMQPITRTNSYLHSFFPSAIKVWNSLPQHVIDSKDIDEFKQRLAGLATTI